MTNLVDNGLGESGALVKKVIVGVIVLIYQGLHEFWPVLRVLGLDEISFCL